MANVGADDEGQAEGLGADAGGAIAKAGLKAIRELESILRNLGQGR
jgi:hypothetical protein